MQADFESPTLSLSQRAHVIAEEGSEFYKVIIYIVSVLGVMVAISLATTPPDPRSILEIIWFAGAAVLISIMIIYAVFKSRYLSRLLENWNKDYLEQSYIVVFDTTVPKGNTNAEKIFNLAIAVFPELRGFTPLFWPAPINRLKQYLESAQNKLRRRAIIPKTWNYNVDSYLLDLVLETDTGLFIIKDFKDVVVGLNDIKQLMKIIDDGFYQEIFRIICVAKHYDQSFLNRESLETLIKNNLRPKFSIDLLIEEEVGYTAIWIS